MTKPKIIITIIFLIQSLIIFLLGCALVTQIIGLSWARNEVFSNCQTDSVNYDDYDPYCIFIIDNIKTFGVKREILVAKSFDNSYGYKISDPNNYHSWNNDMEMHTLVKWNAEGVSINIHDLEIFIPKEKFIGGR